MSGDNSIYSEKVIKKCFFSPKFSSTLSLLHDQAHTDENWDCCEATRDKVVEFFPESWPASLEILAWPPYVEEAMEKDCDGVAFYGGRL